MLVTRVLIPKPDDVFFHYCSTETLMAICEKKNIRFSDVNMMNDHAESSYGYKIFEEAATKILNDGDLTSKYKSLDTNFFDKVDEQISPQQFVNHPIISSFSREPDVLSQWRAYADDGRGFSIGFGGDLLSALPGTLLEVEYRKEQQISEMATALLAIFLENEKSKKPFGPKFREDCYMLGFWKYGFKHPSFSEEKEVRCLHLLDVVHTGGWPRLVDAGGVSDGRNVRGQPVKYRSSQGAITAYIDIPFSLKKGRKLFRQLWTGPKNPNGPGNVLYMLGGFGIGDVDVHRSESTYR
jgi:Protein of unknown function (DUF2971)